MISLVSVCQPLWCSGLWSTEEKMFIYFYSGHPHVLLLRGRLRLGGRGECEATRFGFVEARVSTRRRGEVFVKGGQTLHLED